MSHHESNTKVLSASHDISLFYCLIIIQEIETLPRLRPRRPKPTRRKIGKQKTFRRRELIRLAHTSPENALYTSVRIRQPFFRTRSFNGPIPHPSIGPLYPSPWWLLLSRNLVLTETLRPLSHTPSITHKRARYRTSSSMTCTMPTMWWSAPRAHYVTVVCRYWATT